MEGNFNATLPQSGFVQQAVKQGQNTVGFCSFVTILANNFLPVNRALRL
jgi:hypothetical protein